MKTFSKNSMPDVVKYQDKEYYYLAGNCLKPLVILGYCMSHNLRMIQVNVMSRQLKGKTDLHGHPYTPSPFIFTSPKATDDQKRELSDLIRQAQEFTNEMSK